MYKIACFWLSTFVFYSPLRLNSITVFNMSTRFGIFYLARLVRMCWIASKTSTWIKQFKREKRKMIKPMWIKKVHFSVEMFFVCSQLPCTFLSNVTVFFGLVCTEIQGRDWRFPKSLHVVLNSSNSHRLEIEILVSHTRTWNCIMQSPHINEHGNLCITTVTFLFAITIIFLNNWSLKTNETKAMKH